MRALRAVAVLAAAVLAWGLPSMVLAGRNAGGALIVHTNDAYSFSSGTACTTSYAIPTSCEEAITRSDKSAGTVVWLLAAFDSTATPSVSGIYFGIDYHDSLNIVSWKFCGPAGTTEIPDDDWPYAGRGNSLAFGTPIEGEHLFPFYVFKIDGGAEGRYFGTAINPTGAYATFVDDSVPPSSDQISSFGTVGWYTAGWNYCPGEGAESEQDPDGWSQDNGYPDPEWQDSADEGVALTRDVSICLDARHLAFQTAGDDFVPLNLVSFDSPALERAFRAVGTISVAQAFPLFAPADTVRVNLRGTRVRQVDLSTYYHLRFSSVLSAQKALYVLLRTPGVRHGGIMTSERAMSPPQISDSLFWRWPPGCTDDCIADPQWHIFNQGLRPGVTGTCEQAVEGFDIGVDSLDYWPNHSPYNVMVGIVDSGILDDHEDLSVVPLDDTQEHLLKNHPHTDWCTDHATKMAGLAAALTDNALGVAGVCPDCPVLDIEVSDEDCTCESHADSLCRRYTNWPTRIDNAVSLFLDQGLRVLNCSFGGYGSLQIPEQLLALWNAFLLDVSIVAANGDNSAMWTGVNRPACFPFVVAAGGFVHDGRFWEGNTSCAGPPKGNTFSYALDVCAPSDPGLVTTHAESPYYAVTSGQSSGASAIVAGAVAWIQGVARTLKEDVYGISADDASGIVAATALPYSADPQVGSMCHQGASPPVTGDSLCTADAYGRGRLNLKGALTVVESLCSNDHPYLSFGKVRWGDPGFTMELTRTFVDELTGYTWKEYRVTAPLIAPFNNGADLPNYVVWPNQIANAAGDSTTTLVRAGNHDWVKVVVAMNRVTGCELQNLPGGTLVGWDFARVEGDSLAFIVKPEDLQFAYTTYAEPVVNPAGIASRHQQIAEGPPSITVRRNPTTFPALMSIELPRDGVALLDVYDVAGRHIRTLSDRIMERGEHAIEWNGLDEVGNAVPSGLYIVRVSFGNGSGTTKLLVVR